MSLKAARKAAIAFESQPAPKAEAPKMPSFAAFQKEHEKRHATRFKGHDNAAARQRGVSSTPAPFDPAIVTARPERARPGPAAPQAP